VNFVRDYGVLELTPEGLPITNPEAHWTVPQVVEPWNGCAVAWEPTDAWRLYAMGAKAMFHFALELRTAMGRIDPCSFLGKLGLVRDRDAQMIHRKAVVSQWSEWSAVLPRDTQARLEDTWVHHLHFLEPETLILNLDRCVADDALHNLGYQRQRLASLMTNVWM
jgi:hypothetical protein